VCIGGMFVLHEHSLRRLDSGDLARDVAWRNSDRFLAASFSGKRVSLDEHRRWFESIVCDQRVEYLICERNHVPFGVVHFGEIDRRHARAHWGLYLGDDSQPRGTGTVLGYCGVEYGFCILRLRKIVAEILCSNVQSVALHKRLGFLQEGRLRAHVLANGVYRDVLVFALFVDQWKSGQRQELGPLLFSDWNTWTAPPRVTPSG